MESFGNCASVTQKEQTQLGNALRHMEEIAKDAQRISIKTVQIIGSIVGYEPQQAETPTLKSPAGESFLSRLDASLSNINQALCSIEYEVSRIKF